MTAFAARYRVVPGTPHRKERTIIVQSDSIVFAALLASELTPEGFHLWSVSEDPAVNMNGRRKYRDRGGL